MEVRIPRHNVLQRRAPMTLRFLSMALGPGAVYTCEYRGHAHLAGGFESSPMATVLPFERPCLGHAS